jgi:hypothetical protein
MLALVDVVEAATAPFTKRSYVVAFGTALQENATGFATAVALFAGASSDGGAVGHCGDGTLTDVVTETALFARFDSGVDDDTVALSVMLPAVAGAAPLMVIGVALPTGTADALQLTTLLDGAHVQPVPEALPKATPDGSVFETLTFCAVVGPAFATLMTYVSGAPALTDDGALMAMERSASVVTATLALPVEMQPPLFVLTDSVIVPFGPAVKVMAFVPWPAVIVAFVADQLYVVPLGPAATEAG